MGLAAAFLIHATVSGTWAPRLPANKDSLALDDGELGTALVGLAVGLLAGTRLAGAPVDRFGSRRFMRIGFPVMCAALVLPALADGLLTLFLALMALGLVSGALDVAMNAQGIEVERVARRPLLSGLHALWSVGLALGGAAAALAAAADLGPTTHFAIAGAALAAQRGGEEGRPVRPAAVGWAAVSALGFGLLLIALPAAAEDGTAWALLDARAAVVVLLVAGVLALRTPFAFRAAAAPVLAVPGLLLLLGTLFYAEASARGLLSVVSVLASLATVVTVTLAFVVLGERLARVQQVGVAAAIAGTVLLAA